MSIRKYWYLCVRCLVRWTYVVGHALYERAYMCCFMEDCKLQEPHFRARGMLVLTHWHNCAERREEWQKNLQTTPMLFYGILQAARSSLLSGVCSCWHIDTIMCWASRRVSRMHFFVLFCTLAFFFKKNDVNMVMCIERKSFVELI